jgi:transcriptional regulator GlxA family with amidase domain
LLDGLEATTWANAISHLKHEAPKAKIVENRRVVDTGKIITTAAVSTGIDGALHVMARLLGQEQARLVADYLQYRWQPEKEK